MELKGPPRRRQDPELTKKRAEVFVSSLSGDHEPLRLSSGKAKNAPCKKTETPKNKSPKDIINATMGTGSGNKDHSKTKGSVASTPTHILIEGKEWRNSPSMKVPDQRLALYNTLVIEALHDSSRRGAATWNWLAKRRCGPVDSLWPQSFSKGS